MITRNTTQISRWSLYWLWQRISWPRQSSQDCIRNSNWKVQFPLVTWWVTCRCNEAVSTGSNNLIIISNLLFKYPLSIIIPSPGKLPSSHAEGDTQGVWSAFSTECNTLVSNIFNKHMAFWLCKPLLLQIASYSICCCSNVLLKRNILSPPPPPPLCNNCPGHLINIIITVFHRILQRMQFKFWLSWWSSRASGYLYTSNNISFHFRFCLMLWVVCASMSRHKTYLKSFLSFV